MSQDDIKIKRSEIIIIYAGLVISILSPLLTYLYVDKPKLDIESEKFAIETKSSELNSELKYAQSIFNFRPKFSAVMQNDLVRVSPSNDGKSTLSLSFIVSNNGSQSIDVQFSRVGIYTQHHGFMAVGLEENKDFTLDLLQSNRGKSFELSPSGSAVLVTKIEINNSKVVDNKARVIIEWSARVGSTSQYVLSNIVSDKNALEIINDFESITATDTGWFKLFRNDA